MWERSLQDLIRGLRSHKNSSQAELDEFLKEALAEIRIELKGKDMDLKAAGVVKMCYLMMLYPLSPPPNFAFSVVEVMSSSKYHLKQLGYVAAPMAFSSDTEEVVLTVNGIRKDLLAATPHLPPLALMGLSDIVTPALAQDVYADVASLTTHSKAHVRKRAVLALFKIFERYPEAVKTGVARLRDRLEDDDPGVVSATVNVVMELARRSNPQNLLPLSPQLFGLLTTSTNNWMLIKIVKLFALLTPIEHRLVRKLLPPITNLISTTPAISLLYECVRTCITGGMLDGRTEAGDALAKVCVEKLSAFLCDEDQNLKYIALLAMVKIVPTHPHLIADYQEEILQSLDDEDVSIRMRALDLTTSMANRSNVRDIVTRLLAHLVPQETNSTPVYDAATLLARNANHEPTSKGTAFQAPAYRLELVRRILHMTSVDTYANIMDFEWYFSVLIDVAYVSNAPVGEQLSRRMLDVVSRVRSLRSFAVRLCRRVIADVHFTDSPVVEGDASHVIYAAAWICGEYSEVHSAPQVIDDLLGQDRDKLSAPTVAVLITAIAKVFGRWAAYVSSDWNVETFDQCTRLVNDISKTLDDLVKTTSNVIVHERACQFVQLFEMIKVDIHKNPPRPTSSPSNVIEMPNAFAEDSGPNSDHDDAPSKEPDYPKSLYLLQPLFTAYELNSIGYKAQERVSLPEGLDLDKPCVSPHLLVPPPLLELGLSDEESESDHDLGMGGSEHMEALRDAIKKDEQNKNKKKKKTNKGMKPDGTFETREERAARRAAKKASRAAGAGHVDSVPLAGLNMDHDKPESLEPSPVPGLLSSQKHHHPGDAQPSPTRPPPLSEPEIDRQGEMPHGSSIAQSETLVKSKKPRRFGGGGGGGLEAMDYSVSSTRTSSPLPPPPRATYQDYEPAQETNGGGQGNGTRLDDGKAINPVEVQVVAKKKKKKRAANVE